MSLRSIRYRINESNNIWPGFVDVLATLLIVIIFILMVFTVSQIYLSDAISGRDKALENLKNQINQLSKILVLETKEKNKIEDNLKLTERNLNTKEQDLVNQKTLSKNLQKNLSQQEAELFVREQNIIALTDQIKSLLAELRIVANALETFEGEENILLETEGLGNKINQALASRINQLNELNKNLDKANLELEKSEINLKDKIKSLVAINDSLGLEDANLFDQLKAIKIKNELLEASQIEIESALKLIEKINSELILKDDALQNQISQYQEVTNDLLKINDSLGLKDASLIDQLEAIRIKNSKLSELNINLINKDETIYTLRGKILELNNILAISDDSKLKQNKRIGELSNNIKDLKSKNKSEIKKANQSVSAMKLKSSETLNQVNFLSNEIDILKKEIQLLNMALESSEQSVLSKELKIEVLGERLNTALTSKVFELQKYRSEFFGKLKSILGNRKDIKIVGDRFIFESELLFDSASASLQPLGIKKLNEIGLTLKETTNEIPSDIDWIIQVEGHTDTKPINTYEFPSNWELSTARANSVLKLLLNLGFPPNRLSAAGYGEFYPIANGDNLEIYQQNRRIELRLTSR